MLSDGFHNLADSGAFFIALFASIADRQGFGGKDARMNVLGGLVNCSITLVLTFGAFIEAVRRIWLSSESHFVLEIRPLYYMIAIGGILMNGFGAIFLGAHGHSHGGVPCHGDAHNHSHPKKSGEIRTYGEDTAANCAGPPPAPPPQNCCHGHFAFGHSHSHSHSHSHGPGRAIAGLYQNPEEMEHDQLLDSPVCVYDSSTRPRAPRTKSYSLPLLAFPFLSLHSLARLLFTPHHSFSLFLPRRSSVIARRVPDRGGLCGR